MPELMGKDFLLRGKTARRLYHGVAAAQPIFDFHSHLDPMAIYRDEPYDNLAQLWLSADHYKWRAMRAAGMPERLITGGAPDAEKFAAWAQTLPQAAGNPLYHWTHLELQRYFDIREPLGPQSQARIWQKANAVIREKRLSPRKLLQQMNVRRLCTTDDVTAPLEAHRLLQADPTLTVRVHPTFRLDPLFEASPLTVQAYVRAFATRCGRPVQTLPALLEALYMVMDEYALLGCRTADHGLYAIPEGPGDPAKAEAAFAALLHGQPATPEGLASYHWALLTALFAQYHARGWVAQLHLGSLRNGNSVMLRHFGPAAGCDAMLDAPIARPLNTFFDALDSAGTLPRVLLFHIHPGMAEALAAVAGNFTGEGMPQKVQVGPAWWLSDHQEGIRGQLSVAAHAGLLGHCVGMLTDSRSFLSYPRHEYYRRILCDVLGGWVDAGEYPADEALLGEMVENICYRNATRFFSVSEQA